MELDKIAGQWFSHVEQRDLNQLQQLYNQHPGGYYYRRDDETGAIQSLIALKRNSKRSGGGEEVQYHASIRRDAHKLLGPELGALNALQYCLIQLDYADEEQSDESNNDESPSKLEQWKSIIDWLLEKHNEQLTSLLTTPSNNGDVVSKLSPSQRVDLLRQLGGDKSWFGCLNTTEHLAAFLGETLVLERFVTPFLNNASNNIEGGNNNNVGDLVQRELEKMLRNQLLAHRNQGALRPIDVVDRADEACLSVCKSLSDRIKRVLSPSSNVAVAVHKEVQAKHTVHKAKEDGHNHHHQVGEKKLEKLQFLSTSASSIGNNNNSGKKEDDQVGTGLLDRGRVLSLDDYKDNSNEEDEPTAPIEESEDKEVLALDDKLPSWSDFQEKKKTLPVTSTPNAIEKSPVKQQQFHSNTSASANAGNAAILIPVQPLSIKLKQPINNANNNVSSTVVNNTPSTTANAPGKINRFKSIREAFEKGKASTLNEDQVPTNATKEEQEQVNVIVKEETIVNKEEGNVNNVKVEESPVVVIEEKEIPITVKVESPIEFKATNESTSSTPILEIVNVDKQPVLLKSESSLLASPSSKPTEGFLTSAQLYGRWSSSLSSSKIIIGDEEQQVKEDENVVNAVNNDDEDEGSGIDVNIVSSLQNKENEVPSVVQLVSDSALDLSTSTQKSQKLEPFLYTDPKLGQIDPKVHAILHSELAHRTNPHLLERQLKTLESLSQSRQSLKYQNLLLSSNDNNNNNVGVVNEGDEEVGGLLFVKLIRIQHVTLPSKTEAIPIFIRVTGEQQHVNSPSVLNASQKISSFAHLPTSPTSNNVNLSGSSLFFAWNSPTVIVYRDQTELSGQFRVPLPPPSSTNTAVEKSLLFDLCCANSAGSLIKSNRGKNNVFKKLFTGGKKEEVDHNQLNNQVGLQQQQIDDHDFDTRSVKSSTFTLVSTHTNLTSAHGTLGNGGNDTAMLLTRLEPINMDNAFLSKCSSQQPTLSSAPSNNNANSSRKLNNPNNTPLPFDVRVPFGLNHLLLPTQQQNQSQSNMSLRLNKPSTNSGSKKEAVVPTTASGVLHFQALYLAPHQLPPTSIHSSLECIDTLESAMLYLDDWNWFRTLLKEGSLHQNGGDLMYWKRRYFKLVGAILIAYHETDANKNAHFEIDLRRVQTVTQIGPNSELLNEDKQSASSPHYRDRIQEELGRPFSFRLYFKSTPSNRQEENDDEAENNYLDLCADSEPDMKDWISKLKQVIHYELPERSRFSTLILQDNNNADEYGYDFEHDHETGHQYNEVY